MQGNNFYVITKTVSFILTSDSHAKLHKYSSSCWTPRPHLQCRGLKLGRSMPLPTLRAFVAYKGRTFTFATSCNLSTDSR